jgi:hypothetical protein
MGGRAKHRIGDSGLVESAELLVAADFFDAEVEWIGGQITIVGIPARPSMAAALEPARPRRRSRCRCGQSRPCSPCFAPGKANKGLAGENWNKSLTSLAIFTRVK